MNKRVKYLIILFLSVFLLPLNVSAAEDLTLKVDKTKLKAGDSVTVTVDLDYNKSLYAFTSGLSFDENIFEVPETYNFKEQDEWSDVVYNKENKKFALLNKSGNTKNHLLVVKLFVRNNPVSGDTKISLNDPVASDGKKDIKFNNISKTLTIENNGDEITNSSYSKKEVTSKKNVSVQTFKPLIIGGSIFVIFLFIGIVLINSKIFKNKLFIKKDDRKKIIIIFSILLILILGITIVSVFKNGNKGDTNGDGKKDYSDAKNINEYLIDIINEDDEQIINNVSKKNFDVNSDGKITITDAAKQEKNATNKTNYSVELKRNNINYYPKKNENVELKFSAKINPNNVKIKEIYVNKERISVTINENDYSAIVKASNKSGIQKYTITKVVLSNGKEIDINDLTFTIDVLKSEPKIEEFNYENNNISIILKDYDKAIKNAHIKIVKGIANSEDLNIKEPDDFESNEIVFEQDLDINSSKISIDLTLDLGQVYTVLITGNYDLDTNELDSTSNYYENQVLYHYTFTNGEVLIAPITKLDELYPKQGETVNFEFEASILPKTISQIISKVVIDGVERNVNFVDGHYIVTLDESDTPGEKQHKISSVVLDDNTRVLCNYEIVYNVLKKEPQFTNFIYHDKEGKITFNLNDKDKSVKNAKIIITEKGENSAIFEQDLNLAKRKFEYNVNLEKGVIYDIKITGSYDLDDDKDNNKNDFTGNLFSHELTVHDVKLSAERSTYYVEKNGNVELKFNAIVTPEDNKNVITEVTIGDKNYNLNHYEDGSYGVIIDNVPSESGIKEYKITKVVLSDDEINKELNFNVDVLKDKPKVENLCIDETSNIPKITFTLIDNDNALKDNPGEIIIRDNQGEVKKVTVQEGENTVELDDISSELQNNSTYYLDIKLNYDLDSYKNDGKNEHSEYLIQDHKIKIYNATLELEDKNNYYFKKGEIKPIYINANINPNDSTMIKSFVMEDGTLVDAIYEDGLYHINIKALESAGKHNYNIEKVILTNDVKINANLTFTIDVLKDVPYINKLNLNDDNKSLSYELTDVDGAFKEGTITIYDNKNTNIKSEKIEDSQTINYNFSEDEIYKVKVVGNYDLDSDSEDENNAYNNEEMYSHSFIIGGDYNFNLTDVTITNALQKDEKPIILFTSTNTRNAKVQKVTLNGKEYNVTNVSGDNYEVLIEDANMNFGDHKITFDNVKLDTLKVYENNKDFKVNTLTYTILKEAPSITDINLTSNNTNKTINVKFKLHNDNFALTALTLILVDSSDKIVSSKSLTFEEIYLLSENTGITLSYNKNTDGKYKVKFLADYELSDKYRYNSQNIAESEIFIKNNGIYIDTVTLKKSKYVNKGQKNYEISYDVYVGENIKTNNDKKYTRLSAISVNGINYIASQESTNRPMIYKSKIGITTPNESGVLSLTANRVQLELNSYYDKVNNYYSVEEVPIQIEVLKDIPKIENLKLTKENYENGTATFEFDVKLDDNAKDYDESFKDGSVELGMESYKIKRGHNIVEFKNIIQNENHDLIFKASYDLDTDALNGEGADENEYENKEIYRTKYGLFNSEEYKDINITEGKAISKNGNNYFEKNEDIKLNFNIIGDFEKLGLSPEKVIIKNKEYTLTKVDSGFEITHDGYKTFGEKEIDITGVILNNGKTIDLENACKIKLEVLKDIPKIIDYKYEVKDDKINITFNLKDSDGSIVDKAKVKITDEDGNEIINKNYKDEFTIDKSKTISRYYLEIVGDYDRDIDTSKDSENYYGNVKLLDEIISLESNNIELKDINDINLYKKEIKDGEEEINLINEVSKKDLIENINDYFVEINMEEIPSIRTKISEVKEENGHLILVIDYKYVTKEDSKTNDLKIDFGEIKGDIAKNETHPDSAFNNLLEKLRNNDDVTLTMNYDASSINNSEDSYYIESYHGTLNGNGFTIKNLNKPLFNKIDNAIIENLKFKDVTMPSTSGNGTVAIESNNSKLQNVLIDTYYKQNNEGKVGTLLGTAKDTIISSCNATNFNIYAGWANLQQIGGLVGIANDTKIENSYVIGKIPGGWNFRAGLVGSANNSTFENNYIKVEIGYGMGNEIAFDIASGNNNIFKNNISLATGFKHNMFSSYKESENNYYVDSAEAGDINQKGVTKITENAVNKNLFLDTTFSEEIWDLNNVSYENPPIFKSEKLLGIKGTKNENFDENKLMLYSNLTKLMPFYKTDEIIKIANNIDDEDLNNKEIAHIIPIDSNGNIVTYLTTDNIKKINKIKLVYKTNEHKEYKVIYDNTYDMVASYRIPELKIDYNYNHYIIDSNSQVVNDLTNYLKSLSYTESLDVLTSTEDSRIYKDFYNKTTSKELKEFVLKYLSNSNYTNINDDKEINSYIEKTVKKNNEIEKVLYMYNYFRRFYDLEIDGMKLYDFMLFNMEGFDKSLTPTKVSELYFADDSNFNTASTGTKYASVLGNYTKQNTIAKFLEYMVTEFGDGNLDKWTKDQFKGYLVEIPVDGMEDEIQYTLWDHFSNEDANYKPHRAYDMMLPILTLPKNAAYIVSTPVQYVIGAQRSYIENPDDPKEQDILKRRIKSYSDRMGVYYNTAYKILGDTKVFNDIHTFHLDKRYAYDENGALVYQQIGTEEPFHKNFNELTGRWQTSDGNAAVAWGDRIDWSAEGMLDGYIDPELAKELGKDVQEYTYHTFTHETAHNIDSRLFLKNNGRRFDAGGEDYADSNLTQAFGPNDIVMNLSVHFNKGDKIGSSWDPSRIDSPEKIKDYYDKVFQTIYVMDYIEAQAFLQLSSEDKAEIGIQVTYPNESVYKDAGNKYRARQTSGFNQRTAEEWDKMELNSIDDLIDNRIMKYAGVYQYSSRGSNSYGGEGINTAHWYQPNNPDGRPDSYALKWIAYEMLGYKGYQDGYIEYNSNIHSIKKSIYKNINNPEEGKTTVDYKTDNMAIEKISDGEFENIDDYKKARFKEVGEKLQYLKNVINVNEYVQKLYDALVKDAESTRVELADKLKKDPDCLNNYWCRVDVVNRRSYPESTKVRQEIYYKLKDLTNDFEDEIYADNIQQDIGDFKVKKNESNSINNSIEKIIKTDDKEQIKSEENEINVRDNVLDNSFDKEEKEDKNNAVIQDEDSNSNKNNILDEKSSTGSNEDNSITSNNNNSCGKTTMSNTNILFNSNIMYLKFNTKKNWLSKINLLIFDNLLY